VDWFQLIHDRVSFCEYRNESSGFIKARNFLKKMYLHKIAYFRALHFIHTFFHCILEDSQQGKKSEDLVPFLKKAYKESLETYHGWMAQHLFGVSYFMSIAFFQ
jgi:hypothetical protein